MQTVLLCVETLLPLLSALAWSWPLTLPQRRNCFARKTKSFPVPWPDTFGRGLLLYIWIPFFFLMQIIAGDVAISQSAQWLIAIRSACMNCVRSWHSQDSLPAELYGINLRRTKKRKKKTGPQLKWSHLISVLESSVVYSSCPQTDENVRLRHVEGGCKFQSLQVRMRRWKKTGHAVKKSDEWLMLSPPPHAPPPKKNNIPVTIRHQRVNWGHC